MNKCAILCALLTVGAPSWVWADDLTFNRDIRPILSENCFACHGFDSKQRKADLRLDVADEAYKLHNGSAAITPKDLDQSEVWQRIVSDNPEEVMPPPSTKKQLTKDQKETIRKWIEQGASYQKHWAFEIPVKTPLPDIRQSGWTRNPIDTFILARLEKEGLAPRAEASRATLIRRVSFALTGLPPTLAELQEYEADQTPIAYENMVDRYLKSPRYGEEMARFWLDVARYADTHGLHLDNERTMWAYRDWVIKSFNVNQPFDEFTIEQLAGDLLPSPTRDQLVATGFNRCNVTTSEGGSIDAEFIYRYAVDRTSTAIETWMGLTGGCAVCHDHKYDPLSTREFYSFYSFFLSAADPAMDRNTNTTDPFLKLTTDEQQSELAKALIEEKDARARLDSVISQWMYQDPAVMDPAPPVRSVDEVWLDDFFPQGAKATCSSRNSSIWVTGPEVNPPTGRRALKQASAANYQDKFDGATQPMIFPDGARIGIWVRPDLFETPDAIMVELGSAKGNRRVIWGEPKHYGGSRTDANWLGEMPAPGIWTRLEIPLEKLNLSAGDEVRSVALAQYGGIVWWDGLTVSGTVTPARDQRDSFSLWWKERTGKDTPGVPAELAAILKEGSEKQPASELQEKLLRFYLANIARPVSEEVRGLRAAWIDRQGARIALEDAIPGTFIFKDMEKRRDAFVMLRGQYDKPGEKVEPGVPAIFPQLKPKSAGATPTRLDLAQWLMSEEHPLTSRVTVNRFWQQFLGTGIVKTSFDFGSQGEVPSHPELLDWLAIWYREHDWDTKALVRLIVTSATFRQDAAATPELLRRDPENRLYARGPRFRLDAEQIRDNVLYVSGLIDLKMGGHGVKSYQPPNIWEPVGYSDSNTRFYLQDHGSDLYRRSIYSFLKRTAPPPFMSNFDAPNREQFCSRRERSNTPLQALQLMNDTQHFEAARALATRILTEAGPSADERILLTFKIVLSRAPDRDELYILRTALEQYLDRYQKAPDAASKVIAVGESPSKVNGSATELAAYTLLANLVLNLDEVVTRN